MSLENERDKTFDFSFGQYIGHTKRNLKLFCMWEFENDLAKWKVIVIILNAAVLLTCNLLLGLSELAQVRLASDLSTIASGISGFWFHLLGFFKWFYFVWKVRRITALIRQLEDCYNLSLSTSNFVQDSSKLDEEMRLAKKSSIKLTYVWTLFMMYGVVHWCVNPLLLQWSYRTMNMNFTDHTNPLPYETWIPWDITEVLGYYYAYIFATIGSFAACIGHISYDVFYMTLIMMVCGQFRYLNYSLTVGQSDSIKTSLKTNRKLTRCFLEQILKRGRTHHNAILKFLTSLEKLTSPVMFVECIGIIGILCLVSFEALTMKLKGDIKNTIRVWSMAEYIFGSFAQLFIFCYYATKVTTLGLQVADSAYSCGWEALTSDDKRGFETDESQKKSRKTVEYLTCEIITRAQKPIKLTGGPFYVLSLETFRAVISVAFSYSTVLREIVK